jgi:Nickel responsive protein SCO4226-like
MIYVVERYIPDLDRSGLLNGLRRLQQSARQPTDGTQAVRYLGTTIVLGDDACYCQFEAPSPEAVIAVNRRVGLPVDRIVAAVSVTPTKGAPR